MGKRTPVYKFYYLENNDIIYPGIDYDNIITIENENSGLYGFIGNGIIDGWEVKSLEFSGDEEVETQKQLLINGYNDDRFSLYGQYYEQLGLPTEDWEWAQCVMVTPGSGIISIYPAKILEYHFFRLQSANIYYAWAEYGGSILDEQICKISIPLSPDEEYDVKNQATFLAEITAAAEDVYIALSGTVSISAGGLFVVGYDTSFLSDLSSGDSIKIESETYTVNQIISNAGLTVTAASSSAHLAKKMYLLDNKIQITSITDGDRRLNLKSLDGAFRKSLQEAVLNHKHLGGFDNPSKINLNSYLLLDCTRISGANVFQFVVPDEYDVDELGIPIVKLNNSVLNLEDYTINLTTSTIYLKNSIKESDILQVLFYLSKQYNLSIRENSVLTLNVELYLTDGFETTDDNGNIVQSVFVWDQAKFKTPVVYSQDDVVNSRSYIIYPSRGTIKFIKPLPASADDASSIKVLLTTAGVQVENELPMVNVQSISADSFTIGKIDSGRLVTIDHIGLFRYKEPADFIPTKLLVNQGDSYYFYPFDKNNNLQYTDAINCIYITNNFDDHTNGMVLSTDHNILISDENESPYINFNILNTWPIDNGLIKNIFDQYFGNLSNFKPKQKSSTSLDNKGIFILTDNSEIVKGRVYYSFDYGLTWRLLKAPTINGAVPEIQSFFASQNILEVDSPYSITTDSIYYLGTDQGLFKAVVGRNSADNSWSWSNKDLISYIENGNYIAINDLTNINDITEVLNIDISTTRTTSGNQTTYNIKTSVYLSTNLGLFVENDSSNEMIRFDYLFSLSNQVVTNEVLLTKWLEKLSTENKNKNDLIWITENQLFVSHSSEKIITTSETGTDTIYVNPLTFNYRNDDAVAFDTVDFTTTENINLNRLDADYQNETLVVGNRFLIKNQSDLTENGIYEVVDIDVDDIGTYAVLERTDEDDKYVAYASVRVKNTAPEDAKSIWWLPTVSGGYTIGETPIIWRILSYMVVEHTIGDDYGIFVDLDYQENSNVYYAAHTKGIYRVIEDISIIGFTPSATELYWDYEKYGLISSIKHINEGNSFGTLYVGTDRGIYKSDISLFDENFEGYKWTRVIDSFSVNQITEISVYNRDKEQFLGSLIEITDTPYIESGGTIDDGFYNNLLLYAPNYLGTGARFSVTISSNAIDSYELISGGVGYVTSVINGYLLIDGVRIYFPEIISEGIYVVDYGTQSIKFNTAQDKAAFYYYENEYKDFYIAPWSSENSIAIVYNDSDLVQTSISFEPENGRIIFSEPVLKSDQDKITISVIKQNAYLDNTGETLHSEEIGLFLPESNQLTTINEDYTNQIYLPVTDITKFNSSIKFIQLRPQNAPYEILQVFYSNNKVQVISRSGTGTINSGTAIHLVTTSNQLGIEDYITKYKTNQTYNLNSLANKNTLQLINQTSNYYDLDSFFVPSNNDTQYTGINRGFKFVLSSVGLSTIAFSESSSSITLYEGLVPSNTNSASSPSLFYVLPSSYLASDLNFGTNKGIWNYNRVSEKWTFISSLDQAGRIYFITDTLAGADTGLWSYDDEWVLNEIYYQTIYDVIISGDWDETTFDAYAKSDGLSFVYYDATDNTFVSDYFEETVDKNIYNLFKDKFVRISQSGDTYTETEVDALYLACEDGLYGVTLGQTTGGHTLLTGREMFGANKIKTSKGTTAKIYKIFRTVNPTSNTRASIPIIILSSAGVHKVRNWRACDPSEQTGLTFFIEKSNLIDKVCFSYAQKAYENSTIIYIGTNDGVYKSYNQGSDFYECEKILGGDTTVYDIKIISYLNNEYVILGTNKGIFISVDEGETWLVSNDSSLPSVIKIDNNVFNYKVIGPNYAGQTFIQPVGITTTASLTKIDAYFKLLDLGDSVIGASSNNSITARLVQFNNDNTYLSSNLSSTTFNVQDIEYPGWYSFDFSNVTLTQDKQYVFVLKETLDAVAGSDYCVGWVASSLSDAYTDGSAITTDDYTNDLDDWSSFETGYDFYFKVYFESNNTPTITLENVGFIDNTYDNGFYTGKFDGLTINSDGALTTDIKCLICVLADASKSQNWSEPQQSGEFIKIDSLKNNLILNSDSIYEKTNNQSLFSIWQYGTKIKDISEEFTNVSDDIVDYIDSITYNGKKSQLVEAIDRILPLINPQSIYETIIHAYNDTELTTDEIEEIISENEIRLAVVQEYLTNNNLLYIKTYKDLYKSDDLYYAELTIDSTGAITTDTEYNLVSAGVDFTWSDGYYENVLVAINDTLTDNYTLNPEEGTIEFTVATGNIEDVIVYLSHDWPFNEITIDLDDESWIYSEHISEDIINDWAISFRPVLLIISDGEDRLSNAESDFNFSTLWFGRESFIKCLLEGKNARKDILYNINLNNKKMDIMPINSATDWDIVFDEIFSISGNIFTGTWTKDYDYDSGEYIQNIYYSTTNNAINSAEIKIEIQYSYDRIKYSDLIELDLNDDFYALNKKIKSLKYIITLTEGWSGTAKTRPKVNYLYHEIISPATLFFVTDPQDVTGMMFEYIATVSLQEPHKSNAKYLICRGDSIERNYYEELIKERNGCLLNRQQTILFSEANTLTKLILSPLEVNGEFDGKLFEIVDESGNVVLWKNDDIVTVYILVDNEKQFLNPSTYVLNGNRGTIVFYESQDVPTGGEDDERRYEITFVDIEVVATLYTLTGEQTTTSDYQTYTLVNGPVPPDATVVPLVNNEIIRGGYIFDNEYGIISFSKPNESTDQVTAFIKFSNKFRFGVEIEHYTMEASTTL